MYDVVSGSVNNDVSAPRVKYTTLMQVDVTNPHMVAIVHTDTTQVSLTLREIYIDTDTDALFQFIATTLKGSSSLPKNAVLKVAPASISAMIACLKKTDDYLAILKFVYSAGLNPGQSGVSNTVRYLDIASIMALWTREAPVHETLTFSLK